MTEYRLNKVGNDGRLVGSRIFTADDNEEAVVWAKQQLADHSVELWSGPRLVRRLDPPEQRDAHAVTHSVEAGRMVPKNKPRPRRGSVARVCDKDRGDALAEMLKAKTSRSRKPLSMISSFPLGN